MPVQTRLPASASATATGSGPTTTTVAGNSRLVFKSQIQCFRQRLVMATLSRKAIVIANIRPNSDTIGLTDYEASFLRLLDKVTNGSTIEINYTGTAVTYRPGTILGGEIAHDCPVSRGIGYFLEPLIALAPFAKHPLKVTLNGVTNNNVDVSVDVIRTVLLPQLARFGIEEDVELKITKRGAIPLGGGQVFFKCPIVRTLKPLIFTESGQIKRIRGIAYATRMSPQTSNRVIESARGILNRFLSDIYIYSDVYRGPESGLSPGYALSLVAETTTGALISRECAYQPRKRPQMLEEEEDNTPPFQKPTKDTQTKQQGSENPSQDLVSSFLVEDYTFPTPEDLGISVARQLLQEIKKGGAIDSYSIWMNLLFIALGPESLGKIRVGSLTPFSIQYLRDLKTFFGVVFKITPDPETHTVLLASVGTGYTNVNKKAT